MMNHLQEDMKQELRKISQEFDYLGLPMININVDVLYQLVTSVSKLIHMYRQAISKQNENIIEYSVIRDDLHIKQKKIVALKDEMKEFENTIKQQTSHILMLQLDINDLKTKLHESNSDLQRSRLYIKKKEAELEHKNNRLQMEIDKLKNEPSNLNFLSQDEKLIQTIHKHKLREEIYKDAIKTMQENNEELQREILNLKDEIILSIGKQSSSS